MSKVEKYSYKPVSSLDPGQWVTWDRSMVEEKKRGTHLVHEDDVGSIIHGGHRAKRIATGNLTGCTAVGVVLEKDAVFEAYIQHFRHLRHELGASMLKGFVDSRQEEEFDRTRGVIMLPTTSAHPWRDLLDPNYPPYRPEEGEELSLILSHLPSAEHTAITVAYPNILRVPHNLVIELSRKKRPIITVSRAGKLVKDLSDDDSSARSEVAA